jgi:hypothetical protein
MNKKLSEWSWLYIDSIIKFQLGLVMVLSKIVWNVPPLIYNFNLSRNKKKTCGSFLTVILQNKYGNTLKLKGVYSKTRLVWIPVLINFLLRGSMTKIVAQRYCICDQQKYKAGAKCNPTSSKYTLHVI